VTTLVNLRGIPSINPHSAVSPMQVHGLFQAPAAQARKPVRRNGLHGASHGYNNP
jgi:hypothetical protein